MLRRSGGNRARHPAGRLSAFAHHQVVVLGWEGGVLPSLLSWFCNQLVRLEAFVFIRYPFILPLQTARRCIRLIKCIPMKPETQAPVHLHNIPSYKRVSN